MLINDIIEYQLGIYLCCEIWSAYFSSEVHFDNESFLFNLDISGSELKPQGFMYENFLYAFQWYPNATPF